jgi:uncharacterized membrane protein YwaF
MFISKSSGCSALKNRLRPWAFYTRSEVTHTVLMPVLLLWVVTSCEQLGQILTLLPMSSDTNVDGIKEEML